MPAPSGGAAALDYDDLIVATRRLLESADERRLGALQARRRHRPRAGRRGAGHQPRPVGGDPPPDRGILRRRRRRRAQPHGVRRRRHQAVDLRLPARRSAQAQGDARVVRRASRSPSSDFVPVDLNVSFRSTPAVLDAVDWVFGEDEAARGVAEPGDVEPSAQPQGRARPRRAVAAGQRAARPRSTRPTSKAPRGALALPHERLAHLIAVHAKGLIGQRAARAQGRAAACRPLHGAGAAAQRVRECAGARAEARGNRGGGRRSPEPGRRARDPGSAGAGALRAAAAGRSQPRLPAEIAADRPRRGAALHAGLEAHRPSLAGAARARAASRPSPPPMRGCRPGWRAPTTPRRSISSPRRSVPKAAAWRLLERLGREAPIRSTSCWRARCSISAPRAARCRASCAGSRRAAARSSATSTPNRRPRGAHPDRARLEGPAGADRLSARHHARAARHRAAAGRRRRRGAAVAAARRRRQRGRPRLARRGPRARAARSRTACSTSP